MATSSPTPQSNSRRLFSDSEEIIILNNLYQLNKKENIFHSSASASAPLSSAHKLLIFNRINRIIGSKFTQNQLSDKIRHFRRKYKKQSRANSSNKSPHDRRLFELSRKIWGSKRTSQQTESDNGAATDDDCDQRYADEEEDKEEDKEEIEDVEQDENEGEEEENKEPETEEEEENEENMAEEEKENGFVEGTEAENEDRAESYGGDYLNWSNEKQQVVLNKYPSLVSEFSRRYPGNMVWREGFECLGAEKLREMNDKWLALRSEEANIIATKCKLLEQQSKLLAEAFKSLSKKN